MMARSKCSNQRPDTLMQDRSPPARRNHLQRTAGPYIWVKLGRTQYEHMFSALHLELGHCSMQAALRICAMNRHAARSGHQINTDEVFGTHRRRRRRRPVVQGRAMSNGCTFAPPAIRGFDGSKCSRCSRFWTSPRATTKASFRPLVCRSATLKKASPK